MAIRTTVRGVMVDMKVRVLTFGPTDPSIKACGPVGTYSKIINRINSRDNFGHSVHVSFAPKVNN